MCIDCYQSSLSASNLVCQTEPKLILETELHQNRTVAHIGHQLFLGLNFSYVLKKHNSQVNAKKILVVKF